MEYRHVNRAARALALTAVVVLVASCGAAASDGDASSAGDRDADLTTDASTGTIAPECGDVPELTASLPEGSEPTGTTAEPVGDGTLPDALQLQEPIERWARQEAADTFAGLWLDQDLPGFAVAFSADVDANAAAIREAVDPRIAVGEADHSLADLGRVRAEVDAAVAGAGGDRGGGAAPGTDELGDADDPLDAGWSPGDLQSFGIDELRNRVAIALYEPDAALLRGVSATLGADTICFEIDRRPDASDAIPAPFAIAEEADLTPSSTSVDVLVNEVSCASGQGAEGRIPAPRIEYGDTEVVVTIGVIPVPGAADCQGNPDTPFTVELDDPLGDRDLLDGSHDPPAPPTLDR